MVSVKRKSDGIDDRIPLTAWSSEGRIVQVSCHDQIGLSIPKLRPGFVLRRNGQQPESIGL